MKIHVIQNVEYWYDRSTRCWWCSEVDTNGFQIGDADHAYSRSEILEIVKSKINNIFQRNTK